MKWQIPDIKIDENTFIKKIEEKDLEELFEIYSDPEVLEYTDEEVFPDISYMKIYFDSVNRGYILKDYCELKIVYKNKAIGTCDFHSFDENTNQCEIGFLLNKKYWGNGFMKKCLLELIKFLSNEVGVKKIVADIEESNSKAISLIHKLGFMHEKATFYYWEKENV